MTIIVAIRALSRYEVPIYRAYWNNSRPRFLYNPYIYMMYRYNGYIYYIYI